MTSYVPMRKYFSINFLKNPQKIHLHSLQNKRKDEKGRGRGLDKKR